MSLVDAILKSAEQLPPFPVVMQRALQIMEDPRTSAQDVVDVIQYDPSITANLLKLCNSAHFGLPRTVHSLRDAVVLMGFDQVLEIVFSQASARFFTTPLRGYGLEAGELWRHAVACALLPKIIAKRLSREAKAIHFTAALLHDIGKIVMNPYVLDNFETIRMTMEKEHLSFLEAEKTVLGIDHAEVGGWLVEQWTFPKVLVFAVRYHHTPFLTPGDHEFVQLIYLCDLVAMMTGIGGSGDGLSYHAYSEVMRQFGLREKDLETFVIQLGEQFDRVKKVLNMYKPSPPDSSYLEGRRRVGDEIEHRSKFLEDPLRREKGI